MASYHANVKDARIILYLADNQNNGGKTIADKTGLSESEVSKHLNKLKEAGIVDYNTCSPQDGKNYTGKCWYVNSDPDTFAELLNRFVGTEYEFMFLQSFYVQDLCPDDLETHKAIVRTFVHHLDAAQLMLNLFYPCSPLTNELNALFDPITSGGVNTSDDVADGVAEKLSDQAVQRMRDLMNLLTRSQHPHTQNESADAETA